MSCLRFFSYCVQWRKGSNTGCTLLQLPFFSYGEAANKSAPMLLGDHQDPSGCNAPRANHGIWGLNMEPYKRAFFKERYRRIVFSLIMVNGRHKGYSYGFRWDSYDSPKEFPGLLTVAARCTASCYSQLERYVGSTRTRGVCCITSSHNFSSSTISAYAHKWQYL